MNAKQFAWFYLVKNGMGGQKPSYYGGYEIIRDVMDSGKFTKEEINKARWDYDYKENLITKTLKDDLLNIGVDWARTKEPETGTHSEFTDTFHDPRELEYLEGTIYLRNGEKQFWCADKLEVTNVFEMMAMADQIKEEFTLLFGEE
jgi:hypothetical protein